MNVLETSRNMDVYCKVNSVQIFYDNFCFVVLFLMNDTRANTNILWLLLPSLLLVSMFSGQGAGEGPAGSTQGDAVVATSSQGGQPTVGNHISLIFQSVFFRYFHLYFSDLPHGAQPYFSHCLTCIS